MMYLQVPSEQHAQIISESLYTLTVDKDWQRTSQYLIGWTQDVNSNWFLNWDNSIAMPINVNRDSQMTVVLAQFVAAGFLTALEAEDVIEKVRTQPNLTLGDITPASWTFLETIELPEVE